MIPADEKIEEAIKRLIKQIFGNVKIENGCSLDVAFPIGLFDTIEIRIEYRRDMSDPLGGWWYKQLPKKSGS